MIPSRSTLGAGALLVAALITGCSAGGTGGAPAGTAPSASAGPSTTGTSTAGSTGPDTPGRSATSGQSAELPERFPLPDGAKVTTVTRQDNQIAATLIVPDGDRAVDFWRRRLPDAGYRVTQADSVGGLGEVRFSGHGCVGDSQVAVTNSTVAVSCYLS